MQRARDDCTVEANTATFGRVGTSGGPLMRAANGDATDRTVVERLDPLVGTVVDQRFRIDFQIAAGGFGAVYRATDVRTGRELALKVLHPQLTRNAMALTRFRREGATLATLRNPHTVTAYEVGETADGTLYIAMELLYGESLYDRFRARGALPWRQVVHIARGVCSSLAEAHAAGIVHRDLKPANIHLETVGLDLDFAKVLDFGIAKTLQSVGYDSELTLAGQMIGTIDYMSPEQMIGGELTGRSDIFALGVVIYQMVSGRTPFGDAVSPTAILASVLTQTPELLSRHASVPVLLDQVVARCIERDPDHRFGDVGELARALAEVAAIGLTPISLGTPHAALPVVRRALPPSEPLPVVSLPVAPLPVAPLPVAPLPGPLPVVPLREAPPYVIPTAVPVANPHLALDPRGSQRAIDPPHPARGRRARRTPVLGMTAAGPRGSLVSRIARGWPWSAALAIVIGAVTLATC
jgi:serine/threonine-protein kinase